MADEKQSTQINFKKIYNHRVPVSQAQFLYKTAKSYIPYINPHTPDCPYKKLINNLLHDASAILEELYASNLVDYLLAKIHVTQSQINKTFTIQGNHHIFVLDNLAQNDKGKIGTKAAVYLARLYFKEQPFNPIALAYTLRAYIGDKKYASLLIHLINCNESYLPLWKLPDLKLFLLTQSNQSNHLIEKAHHCATKKIILDMKAIDTLYKKISADCDIQSLFANPISFIIRSKKISVPFTRIANSAQETELLATTIVKDFLSTATHKDIYNIPFSTEHIDLFNDCVSILETGNCELLPNNGLPNVDIKSENLNKFLVKCSITHPKAAYLAFLHASESGNDNLAAQLLIKGSHVKTKDFISRRRCIEFALQNFDNDVQKSKFLHEIEQSLSHSFALNRGISLLLGNSELEVWSNPHQAKIYFNLALELSRLPLIPNKFSLPPLTAKEIVQKIVAAIHSKNPISTDFSVLEQLGPPYNAEYLSLENDKPRSPSK